MTLSVCSCRVAPCRCPRGQQINGTGYSPRSESDCPEDEPEPRIVQRCLTFAIRSVIYTGIHRRSSSGPVGPGTGKPQVRSGFADAAVAAGGPRPDRIHTAWLATLIDLIPFLAHEAHHFYQGHLNRLTRPLADDPQAPLVRASRSSRPRAWRTCSTSGPSSSPRRRSTARTPGNERNFKRHFV